MNAKIARGRVFRQVAAGLAALSCVVLVGAAIGEEKPAEDKRVLADDGLPLTVGKVANCGFLDRPETALQGQVPASVRAVGFNGYSCNLELVAQSRGDGANWQTTEWREKAKKGKKSRICGYYGTASPASSKPGRAHLGVPVLDITDAKNPIPTAYLTTTSMLDPWESLKINERRQLLGAVNGADGGGGPEIDIYDISDDCRFPQLLASVAVGKPDGSTGVPLTVTGHEGSWAPDGLTYYGGDIGAAAYYAVDTTNPRTPKLITAWKPGIPGATIHGFSVSEDGMRGYFVSLLGAGPVTKDKAANGLLIYDLSEIQNRLPKPQVKLIGQLLFNDGGGAQHTIPVKIKGKPYVIFVDETGPGGFGDVSRLQASCDAGLPPFPMARIIDISDETKPKLVSRLGLETHDPANCDKVLPDLAGLAIFMYGSHYCSVDNMKNATTLACGYFNSGIRVFDIRNPKKVKEIAYYNPAGTTTASPGSNHVTTGQWKAGGPDWCSAQVHLDVDRGTLWTTCQDNGYLMLRFTNDVWPFAESKTPPGQQN